MNNDLPELTFEEIKIGLKKSFEIEITDSLIKSFSELSGDFNPLHTDKEYAISNGFGNKVCHGMLLGSFFSQLIGMYLPGKNALYFSQSLNFINPCLVNEKIIIQGEVTDKSESTKIISIKTKISNQSQKVLVDGIARVRIRND
ncbi:MAG: enoyl-CoA hydratase [Chloroflexi bacterium]|nr:enoyl-CoA hydratase [Chloroflexota bacterium]|tara:strand:+ start:6550 stop:6981 length:432 start_codon:yes stop_codon:yes gene_type:complete